MSEETPTSPEKEKLDLELKELEVETKLLDLEAKYREVRGDPLGNDAHYEYWFTQGVDQDSTKTCLETFARWHRRDPHASFRLVLNSPGGDTRQGLHLYDELYGYSQRGGGTHHLTTVVRGAACSMAATLSQVGDHRLMGPNAQLMFHDVSAITGGTRTQMLDDLDSYTKTYLATVNIVCGRSGMDQTTFRAYSERNDWWLTADDALGWNLIDGIG